MSQFGKGWIPDPAHVHGLYGSGRGLLGAALGKGGPEWMPPVLSQGGTSECTGFSLSENASTYTRTILSPHSVYIPALCIVRAGLTMPLLDVGTFPWAAISAIEKGGVATIEDWPWAESTVTHEPSILQLEKCMHFPFKPHRLFSHGYALADDFDRALSAGRGVSFGSFLRQSFEDYSGGVMSTMTGDEVGGHFVFAYRVERLASGKRVFRVRNSWGGLWGEDGDVLVDDQFIAEQASDAVFLEMLETA